MFQFLICGAATYGTYRLFAGPRNQEFYLTASPQTLTCQSDTSGSESRAGHASFRLRNQGANAVTIRRIRSTCACSTPDLAVPAVLQPGAAVDVPVALAFPEYGRTETQIVIDTEEELANPVTVRLVLDSGPPPVPWIESIPAVVGIFGSHPGKLGSAEFDICCLEPFGNEIWIEHVETPSGAARFEILEHRVLEESAPSGWVRRRYTVRATCSVPESPHVAAVYPIRVVTTSAARQPAPESALVIRWRPDFNVIPEVLVIRLNELRSGDVIRKVTIRTLTPNAALPEIDRMTTTDRWIVPLDDTTGDADSTTRRQHHIRFETAGAESADVAAVTIRFRNSLHPPVTIPVHVLP